MVVSWINRSLTTHIVQSTAYFDDARSLWLDLLDRYSKGNHFCISDILQDIHSMKQGDRNVSTFFTGLKTLWEELESLRPTPLFVPVILSALVTFLSPCKGIKILNM